MKCKSCQKEIIDDYKMCPYCGAAVGNDETIQQNEISDEVTKESAQQPIKQRKSKKGLIIAIIGILLVSAGVLCYFFLYLPYSQPLTQISQKIEAANEIDPLTLVELKNSYKYTLSVKENQIKANVPGEYSVIYTLTNQKTNSAKDQIFKFTVVDTTPPDIKILTSDPIRAVMGVNINILFITIANDIVDGAIARENINIQGTVDSNKLGTYPLTIFVSDKAGNKATKTVNVVVEDKNPSFKFLINIEGYWVNETTDNYCHFTFVNGVYNFSIGNYQIRDFDRGVLILLEANSENSMEFDFDYVTYSYDENNKIHYSELNKKTIIVDTGIPQDNKISVDIGDGKGFQEYKYTTRAR